MKLRCVKLTDGEEVIGRFVSDDDDNIVLNHVRCMAMIPQGDGQVGFSIVPFCAGNVDGNLTIRKANIMVEFDAVKQVEDIYLKQTTAIQLV